MDPTKKPDTVDYASPGRAVYNKSAEEPRRQSGTVMGFKLAGEPPRKPAHSSLQQSSLQQRQEQTLRVAYGDFYSVVEAGSSEGSELTGRENETFGEIIRDCCTYLCQKWLVDAKDLVFHRPATQTGKRRIEELLLEKVHPALQPQVGAYLQFLDTISRGAKEQQEESPLRMVRPYFSIGLDVEISPGELEKLLTNGYPSQPFMDSSATKHVLEQFFLQAQPKNYWMATALGEILSSGFTADDARKIQDDLRTNRKAFCDEALPNIRQHLYSLYQQSTIPARTLVTLAAYARVRGIPKTTFPELALTYLGDEKPIIFCGSKEEQTSYRRTVGDYFRVIFTDGSQLVNCLSYSSLVIVAPTAALTALSAYSLYLKGADEKQTTIIMGVDINREDLIKMITAGIANQRRLQEKQDTYRDSLPDLVRES
ncbi:MAG: hypothetical protein AB1668_03200 [Nanoarchaeota archaeon]